MMLHPLDLLCPSHLLNLFARAIYSASAYPHNTVSATPDVGFAVISTSASVVPAAAVVSTTPDVEYIDSIEGYCICYTDQENPI